jgi:hypothetical protein
MKILVELVMITERVASMKVKDILDLPDDTLITMTKKEWKRFFVKATGKTAKEIRQLIKQNHENTRKK